MHGCDRCNLTWKNQSNIFWWQELEKVKKTIQKRHRNSDVWVLSVHGAVKVAVLVREVG